MVQSRIIQAHDGYGRRRPMRLSRPGARLAVKAGAGVAAMPHWQGDSSELVRVIDNIGLVMPYYLLMHRDMQQNPRVRAFADFVAFEIKSFRALLSNGKLAAT
jgi:DNA-binding transcriptional LysR family regulator